MKAEFRQEAKEHYAKASSGLTTKGTKRRRALQRTLPFLTSFVDQSTIVSTVDLGIREIQLKRVFGSYYEGRSHLFAGDFIPLAGVGTEFADKWINLCAAQLEEGIRDPIVVYEYLNYYYVQEGNKRVSVMKYLQAPTLSAHVIRLIPAYDEKNFDVDMYYAFLEFFRQTDFEDIWFRQTSCFASIIEFMNQTGEKVAYNDYLRSYYIPFRRNYKKLERSFKGTEGLTTGDVFLGYCRLFGLEDMDRVSLGSRLDQVIRHLQAEEIVEVGGSEAGSGTFLPNFRRIRTAFVFPYSREMNGWSRDHARSGLQMAETYKSQVTVDLIDNILIAEDPVGTLEEAVGGRYDFVFLIDEGLLTLGERLAIEYPRISFLICTGNRSSYLVPSYFGKVYQANFLLGMYAALVGDLNRIGYVSCDMSEQIYRTMKAFEAGYKSIRPQADIVYASSETNLPDNIKMAGYYRSVEQSHLTEGTVNTYLKKKGRKVYMAYTYWQWEAFYTGIFEHLVNGSFKKLQRSQREAGNRLFFHWGLDTGVIGLRINESLASKTSELVLESISGDISAGRIEIEAFCESSDYESWRSVHRQ